MSGSHSTRGTAAKIILPLVVVSLFLAGAVMQYRSVSRVEPTDASQAPAPRSAELVLPLASTSTTAPATPTRAAATPTTTRPAPAKSPKPIKSAAPVTRMAVGDIQQYAASLVGSSYEFTCLAHIIDHESGWNPHAGNPDGSYGVPQSLPGAKMSSEGADWRDNPKTQLRWMIKYIHSRYGTPCDAWAWWQRHSWY